VATLIVNAVITVLVFRRSEQEGIAIVLL